MKNIRFSIPNITNEDVKIVGKILKSGWLTHGKYTTLFEEKFKEFTGAKYAVTVSSCTAALHLSCLASNFKKGDEVIVPAQTHTATEQLKTIIFSSLQFIIMMSPRKKKIKVKAPPLLPQQICNEI